MHNHHRPITFLGRVQSIHQITSYKRCFQNTYKFQIIPVFNLPDTLVESFVFDIDTQFYDIQLYDYTFYFVVYTDNKRHIDTVETDGVENIKQTIII